MTVTPLSPATGAEIAGLDLSKPVPAALQAQLREAWHRYSLLVFRGQDLNAQAQLNFARIFGEISTQGYGHAHGFGTPEGFTFVSNVHEKGLNPYGELGFHSDHSYYPKPVLGLMLYALEVPPEGAGGNTLFANMKLVLAQLPPALRSRIEGRVVVHGHPDATKPLGLPGLDENADTPRHPHPLVFTHPVTGEKLLFMSRRHVSNIQGLPERESLELIEELYSYIVRPEMSVTHEWRPGDVVLWDNVALQHARTDFDASLRRHMRRLQIAQ